jgi:hypothetical protein
MKLKISIAKVRVRGERGVIKVKALILRWNLKKTKLLQLERSEVVLCV